MKKFTLLALCAATTVLSTGCTNTNTLYNHRRDFQPKGHGGAWNTEYENVVRGERRAQADALKGQNSHRALWRTGTWQEFFWHSGSRLRSN